MVCGQLCAQTKGLSSERNSFANSIISQQELIQAIKNNNASKLNCQGTYLVYVIAEACEILNIYDRWNHKPRRPSFDNVVRILELADVDTVMWNKYDGVKIGYLDKHGKAKNYLRNSKEKEIVLVYKGRYIFSLSSGEPLLDTRSLPGVIRSKARTSSQKVSTQHIVEQPKAVASVTKQPRKSEEIIEVKPKTKPEVIETVSIEPEPKSKPEVIETVSVESESKSEVTNAALIDSEHKLALQKIVISDEFLHRPAEEEKENTDPIEEVREEISVSKPTLEPVLEPAAESVVEIIDIDSLEEEVIIEIEPVLFSESPSDEENPPASGVKETQVKEVAPDPPVKAEEEVAVEPEVIETVSVEPESKSEVIETVSVEPEPRSKIEKENRNIEIHNYEEVLDNPYLIYALYSSADFLKKLSKKKNQDSPQREKIAAIAADITDKYRLGYMSMLEDQFNEKNTATSINFGLSVPLDTFSFGKGGENHDDAVDLFAREGSTIYSISNGIVVLVDNGWDKDDPLSVVSTRGGNTVIIFDPDNREFYRYAHLEKTDLVAGGIVYAGDYIGTVGHTGLNASKAGHGNHLHLEINRYDSKSASIVFLSSGEIKARLKKIKKEREKG